MVMLPRLAQTATIHFVMLATQVLRCATTEILVALLRFRAIVFMLLHILESILDEKGDEGRVQIVVNTDDDGSTTIYRIYTNFQFTCTRGRFLGFTFQLPISKICFRNFVAPIKAFQKKTRIFYSKTNKYFHHHFMQQFIISMDFVIN